MNRPLVLLGVLLAGRLFAAAPSTSTPTVSPDEALARLTAGNLHFVQGEAARPHQEAARRAALASGQTPFAVVLSCADSRVPPELVFDQGLGDLFVIRVAGNVAGVNETGTIEYGCGQLHAPLCVVLGHSNCGAVKAAVDGTPLAGDLGALVGVVTPAVTRAKKSSSLLQGPPPLAAAVEANVWLAIESLYQRSPLMRGLAGSGRVRVVGAVYDLATGEVRWLGAHPQEKSLLAVAPAK